MTDASLISQLGAVPMPTLGGKQLWGDVYLYAGWRIQQNIVSGHHRLLDPSDIRVAMGSWRHCHDRFSAFRTKGISLSSDHLVLMLHGYGRTKESWRPMTKGLRAAGYEAHAINYPSFRNNLQGHADQISTLLSRAEGIHKLSLVCHSMGGIVARVLMGQPRDWSQRIHFNRLVMIGTPNTGAELVQQVMRLPSLGSLAGPALAQLHPTRSQEIPIPPVKFGIIAGARGDGVGYNPLLPGDDDMTVSLDSTKLPGAEDTLVVDAMHTFIMTQPVVIEATLRYLDTGRFEG